MFQKQFYKRINNFLNCQSGEFAMQTALMFAAFAVVGALIAAPLLDNATKQYAQSRSLGIDPITTASTGKKSGKGNTYIIRKSVLSNKEQMICKTPYGRPCPTSDLDR